jgi:glycosyltransferase involved in cell wall biosynthesis
VKILVIQNRLLFPADTGGKIRTLNVLKHLARWHDVTYLCSGDANEAGPIRQMEELGLKVEVVPHRQMRRGSLRFWKLLAANLASPYPLSIAKNFDPAVRRRAESLVNTERFDLVVCDFLHTARYALGLDVPKVLFQHNVESQILRRHAEHDRGFLRRSYMRLQYRRTRDLEARYGREFNKVIAVSRQDQETFEREYGWTNVRAIDTAVDLDYFSPTGEEERPDRVVFVGSLDWMPNQDGVIGFVRRVWPRIRQMKPGATFGVVGRNPPAAVTRLSEEPGVEVLGSVPDVRPYLAEAMAVVVPLNVGGGTRLKIFAAMAMAKATVSTTLGAEGLPVRHGMEILIADDDAEFAHAVVRLLDDADLRRRIGGAALSLVQAHYGTESVARDFERICVEAAGGRTAQAEVSVDRMGVVPVTAES